MRGRGVGGAIQSINGDTITLTTRDGATATVKVSPETRFVRDGQSAKLTDFKVGDRVVVRGESTGENIWNAAMVGEFTGRGEGQNNGAMMERMREGLGKEFVAGEVKSIDGTKLVVHAPDGKDYTAEVDENTSFKRGREDITFPDIKVGDRVTGRGKVNSDGVFVFATLNAGGLMGPGGRNRENTQPPTAPPKQ